MHEPQVADYLALQIKHLAEAAVKRVQAQWWFQNKTLVRRVPGTRLRPDSAFSVCSVSMSITT